MSKPAFTAPKGIAKTMDDVVGQLVAFRGVAQSAWWELSAIQETKTLTPTTALVTEALAEVLAKVSSGEWEMQVVAAAVKYRTAAMENQPADLQAQLLVQLQDILDQKLLPKQYQH